jgi:hypothetical protein
MGKRRPGQAKKAAYKHQPTNREASADHAHAAHLRSPSPQDDTINTLFAVLMYGGLAWAASGYLYNVPSFVLGALALLQMFSFVATSAGYEAINPFEQGLLHESRPRNDRLVNWSEVEALAGAPARGTVLELDIISVVPFLRIVCEAKDRAGDVRRVAFYSQCRGQSLRGLAPGTTLYWSNPRYHYFADGSSGARIEDADLRNIRTRTGPEPQQEQPRQHSSRVDDSEEARIRALAADMGVPQASQQMVDFATGRTNTYRREGLCDTYREERCRLVMLWHARLGYASKETLRRTILSQGGKLGEGAESITEKDLDSAPAF